MRWHGAGCRNILSICDPWLRQLDTEFVLHPARGSLPAAMSGLILTLICAAPSNTSLRTNAPRLTHAFAPNVKRQSAMLSDFERPLYGTRLR